MKRQLLWIVIATIFCAFMLLRVNSSDAQTPARALTEQRSLVDATMEEVEAYAVAWAKNELNVVTGEPTVMLAKKIELDELPTLGLAEIGNDPKRPYALVMLQGDFDIYNTFPGTNADPETWPSRVNYVVYVFDLVAGMPCLIEASEKGVGFESLLSAAREASQK